MTPSDATKLKTLEDENRRLKRPLAESMLDGPEGDEAVRRTVSPRGALKDVRAKN